MKSPKWGEKSLQFHHDILSCPPCCWYESQINVGADHDPPNPQGEGDMHVGGHSPRSAYPTDTFAFLYAAQIAFGGFLFVFAWR